MRFFSGFTGFYWVLLNVRRLLSVLLGFPKVYLVLMSFNRFPFDITAFYLFFYWVFMVITGFY